ncbi:tRNA preQ1(34) S-adenosylmethionine ribosyltransferase-isomerase QueA [Legionella jordanis]|uniref:S-adenosylmethionine:tRNA ribosyltransferase-isomerase n=1 Tax=Legionella jordanis TaxID=456 RepID=A0A0W0VE84_9GAMM|nr:tRNA preQ1(34) S-adenosylmethionine ribosyltransferase-isomerase QueA [Legionella jordanis]KTD18460.1 S-adenosylmethionine--tRNA ribosyltransferase-isomerase [Legionella jordanis]RMX05365.1 tRNA preQ1(34) S-adenosylmethionine ribosyltransferase-isomerase QueA [Legionella jordanis]RMX20787.1 tRNA preQ1(34) S-adenosylmethionine ribosyltransferase-isomerase QueA [Legionella jordanis]VEH13192.1 S-adenosylmethionine--tRNA ribosyltransferase-isomerase [Legionella jordanis]HAT8715032.1 tRNA preQ1(
MKKQDFYFDLPEELIAQYPLANRTDSRLLAYNRQTGEYSHQQFKDLGQFLRPGDLLVMNNTKVIPARLYGHKGSGGKIELLIERFLENNSFLAHIKASKAPKAGSILYLDKGWQIEVLAKEEDLYRCRTLGDTDSMLQDIGHIPLPLYITRPDESLDQDRYQTVYALHQGSVAAPTAGLHFDEVLLKKLNEQGINLAYSTLHVGAGTFRPVRCDNIKEHKMHQEQFSISDELALAVNEAKAAGHRVIAVGTTALRSLESAAEGNKLIPCEGDTDIFIYPGYEFKICDGLITNFHLPESTLVMLVSAFIGHAETMALYQEAIARRYRFFSYGDATLLL